MPTEDAIFMLITSLETVSPTTSDEDRKMWEELLRQKGEDPLDPGGYFIINGTESIDFDGRFSSKPCYGD